MESKQQLLVGVPAGEGIALDTTSLLSEESEDREQHAPHCSVPSSAPGRLPMRDRLKELPTFMQRQILASFGYKDYTLAARTCPYLHALWTGAVENHRMTGTLFVTGLFCRASRSFGRRWKISAAAAAVAAAEATTGTTA